MLSQSHSAVVKKKLSLALVKAIIVRFLMGFDIDEGINSKDAAFAVLWRVNFRQNLQKIQAGPGTSD